jgi:hypothetical protein
MQLTPLEGEKQFLCSYNFAYLISFDVDLLHPSGLPISADHTTNTLLIVSLYPCVTLSRAVPKNVSNRCCGFFYTVNLFLKTFFVQSSDYITPVSIRIKIRFW